MCVEVRLWYYIYMLGSGWFYIYTLKLNHTFIILITFIFHKTLKALNDVKSQHLVLIRSYSQVKRSDFWSTNVSYITFVTEHPEIQWRHIIFLIFKWNRVILPNSRHGCITNMKPNLDNNKFCMKVIYVQW